MEENHEESTVLKMIGQYFELVLVFLRKLHPLGLTALQLKILIEDKSHPFWVAFDNATKVLTETSTPTYPPGWTGDMYAKVGPQILWWRKFYEKEFQIGLPSDMELLTIIPIPVAGFSWLVIVAKDVSLNTVLIVCQKHFKCSKYTDQSLEEVIQKSERGSAKATTARWFRDRVEADEELKNLSANDLAVDESPERKNFKGITLIERMLLEIWYFGTTKKHLDISNWTLCSGSRYADGCVPCVFWDSRDRFHVDWTDPGHQHPCLRSRAEVG